MIEFCDNNLELWIDKDDEDFAQAILRTHHTGEASLAVGVGLGAREPKRAWPPDRFLELAKWLLEKADCKIIFFGDKHELSLSKYIKRHKERYSLSGIIDIIGKTTLRQTAAILKHCNLFIGNDTGLKHIAVAMGVPVVEISCWPKCGNKFSVNSPYRFGPCGKNNIVVSPEKPINPCIDGCINCNPHCILEVTVKDVKEAIKKLLVLEGTQMEK